MITMNTESGTIIYSENAIANIVGMNVTEIPGVRGLVAKTPADGIWKMLQKEQFSKGIDIVNEDGVLSISIAISVSYGNKFSEIAKNIIYTIKHNIENLTELKVKNVTVTIQEVIPEEKA